MHYNECLMKGKRSIFFLVLILFFAIYEAASEETSIFNVTIPYGEIKDATEDKILSYSFDLDAIGNPIASFCYQLSMCHPMSSSLQNIWSEGTLRDYQKNNVNPIRGAGFTVSITNLDIKYIPDSLKSIESQWNRESAKNNAIIETLEPEDPSGNFDSYKTEAINLSSIYSTIPDSLPIPNACFDLRFSINPLPADFGVVFFTLNPALWHMEEPNETLYKQIPGFKLSYVTLGGDISFRIALPDYVPIRLTAGLGYYFTYGLIGYELDDSYIVDIEIKHQSHTVFLGNQVSYSIGIFDFFGGIKMLFSQTNLISYYNIGYKYNGTQIMGLSQTGIYSTYPWSSVQPELYLGTALKISNFRMTADYGIDLRAILDPEYYYIGTFAISLHFVFD